MANKGTGVAVVGVAAVAFFLLGRNTGSGGGWGFLPGNGNSILPNSEQSQVEEVVGSNQTQAVETVEAEEPAAAEDDGVLTVSVQESQIIFEGRAVTPEELEEALLRAYGEGKTVELVDNGAIKADYDSAAAILDKLNIPYAVR